MGNKSSKTKKRKSKVTSDNGKKKGIEQELELEKQRIENETKILILGSGDSGKTTFIKQLNILFGDGFSAQDKTIYLRTIRQNLVHNMKKLINDAEEINYKLEEDVKELKELLMEYDDFSQTAGNLIKELWSHKSVKDCYEKHMNHFQLPENTSNLFDSIDKIMTESYTPTNEDILNCRIPTTGINVAEFNINDSTWKVIDVGGQRSERRKWIHQFDDVNILIYVSAVSEFNQNLYEDNNINRMKESLELFEKTVNCEYLKDRNCIVLFNKIDLLKKKITDGYVLSNFFEDYTGENTFEAICDFFQKKFRELGENELRAIFHHFTCATDTEIMRGVADAVNTSIIECKLKKGGYI